MDNENVTTENNTIIIEKTVVVRETYLPEDVQNTIVRLQQEQQSNWDKTQTEIELWQSRLDKADI